MEKSLKIIKNDPLLEPFELALEGRHEYALRKEKELLGNDNKSLSDFASGSCLEVFRIRDGFGGFPEALSRRCGERQP